MAHQDVVPIASPDQWSYDPFAGTIDKGYLWGRGSWDDKGCGVCRPAARHSRPATLKHVIIGFRLVRDAE